jgi:hypothetical protein
VSTMGRFLALLSFAIASTSTGSEVPRRDHPILGTWQLWISGPGGICIETYHFDPDGSERNTSRSEVSTLKFAISDKPLPSGFYRIVSTVVETNHQPDCFGTTPDEGDLTRGARIRLGTVGAASVRYIHFVSSNAALSLCARESEDSCVGLFRMVIAPPPNQRLERPVTPESDAP